MFVGCATMVPRIHNTLNDNQPYLSNNIIMRLRICDISIYGSVNLKLAKVAIGFNCRSGSIRRTFFSIIKPLCDHGSVHGFGNQQSVQSLVLEIWSIRTTAEVGRPPLYCSPNTILFDNISFLNISKLIFLILLQSLEQMPI